MIKSMYRCLLFIYMYCILYYGICQDTLTILKLIFAIAVPKANEVLYSWSSLLIGSDPSSSNGITSDRVPKIKSWPKTSKNLLTAKQFPAADILAATRDFNEECLIGEGFTGRVYRGDFSDGQVWYFDHKHIIIVVFCCSLVEKWHYCLLLNLDKDLMS